MCLVVLALFAVGGCSETPQPMSGPPQRMRAAQHVQEPRRNPPASDAPGLARPGHAEQIDCTPSGREPRNIGVVVIHAGHTFDPVQMPARRPSNRSIDILEGRLRGAGFQVIRPEMPWTVAHPYDRSFEDALSEIAAAVEHLRTQGVDRVVIVGHSFGGGAVIAFGAVRGGIDGVAALAAGPDPAAPVEMERRADSIARAEAMMAAGRADTIGSFEDFNGPYSGVVHSTAAHYLSFFSPVGHMSLHRNLAAWPRGVPLLWVDGYEEAERPARGRMIRRDLPDGPLTGYIVVPAWHTAVADFAADTVVAWIKCL
jgi:predicted alpha/beta hydrolase family esterase